MRFGITWKLFLALLATSIVAAVAMAAAVRYSFTSGFLSYINERNAQHLDAIGRSLAGAYGTHGNWAFLEGNVIVWRRLLRSAVFPEERTSGEEDAREARARGRDPREGRMHQDGHEGRFRGRAERELGPNPRALMARLAVLDAERRFVVGRSEPSADAYLQPIVLEGRTVGFLADSPLRRVTSEADLRFQERQLRASWIIGALAVVLAAVVAILLARVILAPVKRIAGATHRLAAGDYATRVAVGSRDELGRLAEDFNRLAQTLEKNERLRRDFMADISHELRTPLAVLRGEIEAIEDGVRSATPESLRSLRGEVAALSKLVDDLYDLSLADVGALRYRMTSTDVAALLRDALAAFGDRLRERTLALDTAGISAAPLAIEADPDRLRQLFHNLLENSVRYTDPGGRLRIAVRRERDRVVVDFQDSAPGVSPELLPRLFERLYRVDPSRSRAGGGAGLGLALAKSIVEAHGGTIAAKPSPLGGVWFEIDLPAAATHDHG